MARRGPSRRLVVDACVVQSAGAEDATSPVSRNCRDVLKAIYDICHRVVLTPDLDGEWRRHMSGFARKWRRWMKSKRKVEPLEDPTDDRLRREVEHAAPSRAKARAMLKDMHLVEAALATDNVVVSSETNARRLFAAASSYIPRLANVMWVDPSEDPEGVLDWLRGGARQRRSLTLDASRTADAE